MISSKMNGILIWSIHSWCFYFYSESFLMNRSTITQYLSQFEAIIVWLRQRLFNSIIYNPNLNSFLRTQRWIRKLHVKIRMKINLWYTKPFWYSTITLNINVEVLYWRKKYLKEICTYIIIKAYNIYRY